MEDIIIITAGKNEQNEEIHMTTFFLPNQDLSGRVFVVLQQVNSSYILSRYN